MEVLIIGLYCNCEFTIGNKTQHLRSQNHITKTTNL